MNTLHIGELFGGGLALGWACSARCQHCLYRCSPERHDGAGVLDALLDKLAQRAPRARLHIGGGEPFLDRKLLRRAIAGLIARGLTLDYVETNGSWVQGHEQARQILSELAGDDLRSLLVSVSPFHAEHISPRRTQQLIDAADAVLPGGALVWLPELWPDVMQAGGERLDLNRIIEHRGDDYACSLAARYGLISGGRAGRFLQRHGVRMTWQEAAQNAPCRQRLSDTSHFHVDCEGNYLPGLCAGLSLPIERLPGDVALDDYPVVAALLRGGPAELVREFNLLPTDTYSSACDLCTELRDELAPQGFAELAPAGFYSQR